MLTHLTMRTFLPWALTMKTYKFLLEDPREQELLLSFLKTPAGHYLPLMRTTAMWIWAASLALRTSSKPQTRKQKGTVINYYVRPASLGQTRLGIISRFSMLVDLYPSQEMLTRKIGRIQDKPLSVKKKKRHQINSLPCKWILDLDPMICRQKTKNIQNYLVYPVDLIFVAGRGNGESLLCFRTRKVSDFLTEWKESLFAGRGPASFFNSSQFLKKTIYT